MKQSRLLEKDYLEWFLQNYILNKYKVKYSIEESITTNSTYLRMTYRKGITVNLRISDHYSQKKHMKQFLIIPERKLTFGKKELFRRTLINTIKLAQRISTFKYMEGIDEGSVDKIRSNSK